MMKKNFVARYREITEFDVREGWNETDFCPWATSHPVAFTLLYVIKRLFRAVKK